MGKRKQPDTGFSCRFVFGSKAEEARNEYAEGVSVRIARHHAEDRLLPLPNLVLDDSKGGSDLILAHGQGREMKPVRGMRSTEWASRLKGRLLWLTLRQPLLTPPLRFALLGFLPDTRLFVKPSALQFSEESFPREFLLGNFESFLDVIIEDFDFHSSRLCAFPGDACTGFFLVPAWP
jgi:hypothetical protein